MNRREPCAAGKLIRQVRTKKRMHRVSLANLCNVKSSLIQHIELGGTQTIAEEYLKRIAEVLDIPLSHFDDPEKHLDAEPPPEVPMAWLDEDPEHKLEVNIKVSFDGEIAQLAVDSLKELIELLRASKKGKT